MLPEFTVVQAQKEIIFNPGEALDTSAVNATQACDRETFVVIANPTCASRVSDTCMWTQWLTTGKSCIDCRPPPCPCSPILCADVSDDEGTAHSEHFRWIRENSGGVLQRAYERDGIYGAIQRWGGWPWLTPRERRIPRRKVRRKSACTLQGASGSVLRSYTGAGCSTDFHLIPGSTLYFYILLVNLSHDLYRNGCTYDSVKLNIQHLSRILLDGFFNIFNKTDSI